jgi:hypothetical protein
MTYSQFVERAHQRVLDSTPGTDVYHEYRRVNEQRMRRVHQTYLPSANALRAMASITGHQHWMVITEDWCGDSAQTLPAMAILVATQPLVTMEIVDRDATEHINNYLTNGTKSIPIVVAKDASGTDLWVWGPRPQEAQTLYQQLRQQQTPTHDVHIALHTWYASNKLEAFEMEIAALVHGSSAI